MKNRFFKNLFQFLTSLGVLDTMMVFVLLMGLFETGFQNREFILLTLIFIAFLVLVNLACSYWIFQRVLIDENGISVYFFGRMLRHVPWDSIEAIKRDSVMRNMCYVISILNEETPLNLDYRKSIKRAMIFYAPKNIAEIIEKIPKEYNGRFVNTDVGK